MNSISHEDPKAIDFIARMAVLAGSTDPNERKSAEKEIKDYQTYVDQQTGFVPLLLTVALQGIPSSIFASIVLKNTVRTCWDASHAEHCIQEADKYFLKELIIRGTISLTDQPVVQRNLVEAIEYVAVLDFPSQWPNALLPIIEALTSPFSITTYASGMSTAHSILHRYRNVVDSDEFVKELQVVFKSFFRPLVDAMAPLAAAIESQDCTSELREKAVIGLTAAMECMLDLSQLDVGDEFLDSMEKIVQLFLRSLSFPFTSPAVIELKSVVVSCVKHFLLSFDEDFENFAGQFLKLVWDMIADPSSKDDSMNDLVVCGLDLLSNACRSPARTLFDTEETITLLLHQVAIPNLMLSDEELDLFTNEPDMYIQRDVEGSDLHTRRYAGSDIIRTLVLTFAEKVKPILLAGTQHLFEAAASDWRAKDTAIYIASTLLLDGKRADAQRGAAVQSMGSIIPFETLVHGTILPELTSPVSEQSPLIIKADCLRFIATFKSHFEPSLHPHILAGLVHWLQCDNYVVSAYAAHALTKMIQLEAPRASPQEPLVKLLSPQLLQPHGEIILRCLCTQIQDAVVTHTYQIKCLNELLRDAPSVVQPYLLDIAYALNNVLSVSVKNSSNSLFSHYMFDCISKCVAALATQYTSIQTIEEMLLPNFTYILANDVLEYIPYTLQILAQILDCHAVCKHEGSPPNFYQGLLEPLLTPALYSQRGTIPAASRILISYIEHFSAFLNEKEATPKILNTVRLLVQLKNYDHEGLAILHSMLLSYSPAALEPYLQSIFQMLLERLQVAKTPKYVRIFIIFLSVAIVIRGAPDLVERFERIQSGLFMLVLDKVWLPNMQKITGALERKVCVVAMANLLCECPLLQSNGAAWSSCVYRGWSMIYVEAEKDDHSSFVPATMNADGLSMTATIEKTGSVFCPLEAATRPTTDVCKTIHDPVQYFRQQIGTLLSGTGASLQPFLPPEVLSMFSSA